MTGDSDAMVLTSGGHWCSSDDGDGRMVGGIVMVMNLIYSDSVACGDDSGSSEVDGRVVVVMVMVGDLAMVIVAVIRLG